MPEYIHIRRLLPRMLRFSNMWFTQPNIWCLKAYLDGYLINSQDRSETEFFRGFNEWIATKYDANPEQSWESNIVYFTGANEHKAMIIALEQMVEYSSTLEGNCSEWIPEEDCI